VSFPSHWLVKAFRPLLSAASHYRLASQPLFCPLYHLARQTTPAWWNARYPIRTQQLLEQDLDWLLRLAPPVSLQELLDWKQGKRERPSGWFLSFDDGYRELADIVAPLLKRKGVPATFFICSSLVDNRQIFFEDLAGLIAHAWQAATKARKNHVLQHMHLQENALVELLHSRVPRFPALNRLAELLELDVPAWLREQQPYLTSPQIRHLLADGFSIGAHSVDHPLFCEIPEAAAKQQLQQSLAEFVERFELSYRVFAFPYGEHGLSRDFLESLKADNAADLIFGTRGIVTDEFEPFLVQRLLAEDPRRPLPRLVRDELNLQLQRRIRGRGVVRRRG
jgi:peptidoglycan/xylan/chitin deacetylase (PgdA/CDA1 family)